MKLSDRAAKVVQEQGLKAVLDAIGAVDRPRCSCGGKMHSHGRDRGGRWIRRCYACGRRETSSTKPVTSSSMLVTEREQIKALLEAHQEGKTFRQAAAVAGVVSATAWALLRRLEESL